MHVHVCLYVRLFPFPHRRRTLINVTHARADARTRTAGDGEGHVLIWGEEGRALHEHGAQHGLQDDHARVDEEVLGHCFLVGGGVHSDLVRSTPPLRSQGQLHKRGFVHVSPASEGSSSSYRHATNNHPGLEHDSPHAPTIVGLGEFVVFQHPVGDGGVKHAVDRVQRRLHADVGEVVRAFVCLFVAFVCLDWGNVVVVVWSGGRVASCRVRVLGPWYVSMYVSLYLQGYSRLARSRL